MTDTVRETNKQETTKVRTRSSARFGRSLVSGLVALVKLSVVGGLLVGLFAGRAINDNAELAKCAKAVRIFDLLLVTPLAIGIAAALVAGLPAMRVLRARKTRDPRPTRPRNVLVVVLAAVGGWVAAAVFWSISGFMVPRISIMAAHWLNGDDVNQLHTEFYGFKLPSVENWSIVESIGLALVLVAVACIAGWRYSAGEGRPSTRRVLTIAAVLTVLLGVLFTWRATSVYHDMSTTAMAALGQR
jgi:hypothetical protein